MQMDVRQNLTPLHLTIKEIGAWYVGRGYARINPSIMHMLSISEGQIIEIRGKYRTVAKCLPIQTTTSNEEQKYIYIDGIIRYNAGINIGDQVAIRKVKSFPAERIFIHPLLKMPPSLDMTHIAAFLQNIPTVRGDRLLVSYEGTILRFVMIDGIPALDDENSTLLINQHTKFTVNN